MLDVKIIGGTVVDGSGAPRRRADIGISDGRIVVVGDIAEEARETVDATGRIVAPGFIDSHSHYDAQVFWDPKISPSCFHGVTTVLSGFCGFSIAPSTPEASKYLGPMLARVEGMPLATLDASVPWSWSSFDEFLGTIDGQIGVNVGFFAGHSAIRRVVMGTRAVGEKSTPEELEKMKVLLGESLAGGALGFSTSLGATHSDGDGNPVPSRWADHSEIVELSRVVSEYPGTSLELLPHLDFAPEIRKLMIDMSVAGQRPVNWNVLTVTGRADTESVVYDLLTITDEARKQGGEVIALTLPASIDIYMCFRTGFTFEALPGVWQQMFKWPIAERIEKYKDPAFRRQMAADAASMPSSSGIEPLSRIGDYTVITVAAEHNKKYQGRRVGEIAKEEGREPIDVMVDLALDDNLDAIFKPDIGGYDRASYELRARLWQDDRTLIGGSDAGAHVDMLDTFALTTSLLQKSVRELEVITLEDAIQKITRRPAELYGLIDRGMIAEGYHADLIIFDEKTVAQGPLHNRYDLPGSTEFRLYADAIGIDHVFVNGIQIVRFGEHTEAMPGTVLRSGKDTRTMAMDVMRARETA